MISTGSISKASGFKAVWFHIMGLTSIHANGGDKLVPSSSQKQSNNEKNVEKTQSKKDSKYTVADIDKLYQPSPAPPLPSSPPLQEAIYEVTDEDEDMPMLDMDDQSVELVSNYLSDRRSSDTLGPEAATLPRSRKQIDSSFPMMVPTRLKTVFVVDTNFIISHLSTLETLRTLAPRFHHQIVIPSTVMQELDGLKVSSYGVAVKDEHGGKRQVAHLARSANDWIYKNLANLDSGIMGQKLRQTIDSNCIKDDAILDCCLYFKDKLECFVVLMSNDKNLCLKALTEQVLTISFRKGMSAQLIASKAYEENLSRFGSHDFFQQNAYTNSHSALQFHELMSMIYNEVHDTVVEAVDYAMRQEYGDELEFIDYSKDDLLNLKEISRFIAQFWISVFGQLFQKSKMRQSDWKELPSSILEVPTTSQELALFIRFWEEVLTFLFVKRSDQELEQLDSLSRRWEDLAAQCS
ncbi:ZYRO0C06952p [Zygosaccharomyces rouxii]|uniref:Transcriptional protein SWT1 n=1 Tax=Zygosaccharomyces rouxii (strain ATCC 2623 / CBS 732 / NBRC 1130 / NCYC 568 / NRRL Y-229) TaxID=559307 RepID=C5DTA9_ZYGRC|nr:uncharacterized protein ZYRO0C06952g [Zygosaccharomyces rouxii]KAH9201801.1 PIN domain-containing protein [Zygosaccharomyces rouxii]CAR27020.1 ZYRO0C06952p [Zygosaccharomyces rouxii]